MSFFYVCFTCFHAILSVKRNFYCYYFFFLLILTFSLLLLFLSLKTYIIIIITINIIFVLIINNIVLFLCYYFFFSLCYSYQVTLPLLSVSLASLISKLHFYFSFVMFSLSSCSSFSCIKRSKSINCFCICTFLIYV